MEEDGGRGKLDPLMRELLELIHFTGQVAAEIHGLADAADIYRTVKEEFARSGRYSVSILKLTDDGAKLEIVETSVVPEKLEAAASASGLRLESFRFDLDSSSIYRQVVEERKTLRATLRDILGEILPRPATSLIIELIGPGDAEGLFTPLFSQGEVSGVLVVSAPELSESFIPSVQCLAQHISAAVEAAQREARLKAMTEELRRRIDLVHRTFNNMSDALFLLNAEAIPRIIDCNRAASAIFGYAKEEMLGKTTAFLHVSEETLREFRSLLYPAMEKGQTHFRLAEFQMKRQDGTLFPSEHSVAPLLDDKGERTGWVGIVRDITERKRTQKALQELNEELSRANAQLKEANRAKDEGLSLVSHELKTPLNSILGYSQVLLEGMDGGLNPEQREDVQRVMHAGEILLGLVDDLLDSARLEAGILQLQPEAFPLEEPIQEATRTVESLAREKGLELRAELEGDLPPVYADRDRIGQVLLNLLSNALKFTDEGEITVRARVSASGMAEVAVEDTGPGIPEEELEAIFQKFSQPEAGKGKARRGTGLGLYISRALVEAQGGRLWAESRPGQGSTFTFTLPLAEEVAPAVASAAPAPLEEEDRVLLVIDDDPEAIELVSKLTKGEGYRTVGATSGEEGIRLARELQPEAIVLDILLPGQTGWQVLHQLRSAPETEDIPVIVASVTQDQELGVSLGVDDYLVKPIVREVLLAKLEKLGMAEKKALVVNDNPERIELVKRILEEGGYRTAVAGEAEGAIREVRSFHPQAIIMGLAVTKLAGFEILSRLKAEPAAREARFILMEEEEELLEDGAGLERALRKRLAALTPLREELRATMGKRELLSTTQAAEHLGINRSTLLRAVHRGELKPAARTPGGFFRFRREEVERYAQRLAGSKKRGRRPSRGRASPGHPPDIVSAR